MWKATLASLRAHKGRVALTGLSVVLGVAFVAGSFILTDTLRATFDTLFGEATADIDVNVRAKAAFAEESNTGSGNREPLPVSLLDSVRAVEGVEIASGTVQGYAQFVDKEGEAVGGMGPPTLGFNWDGNEPLGPFQLREGRGARAAGEVVVDAATASANDFRVGERVKVLLAGPAEEFTIVGIVGFGAADNLAGATLALFDTQTAQRIFLKEGQFDGIGVVGDGSVSSEALRARIGAVLPPGVEAVTQEQQSAEMADAINRGFNFFNTALLMFASVSLFVGAFIIYNTFSILVAQRTRELALLRALGASRRQVIGSVVAEAGVVGLLASLVGLAAGIAMAAGLQALLAGFGVDLPSSDTQVLPRTVIVAVLVGTGITVVASLAPARRAASVPPVAAMAEGELPAQQGPIRRRVVAGAAIGALGLAITLTGLFAGAGFAATALGVAAMFVAVAMASPAVTVPIVSAMGRVIARGTAGHLGEANALRNTRRTASTAAALMVGLGMVSFAAVFAASLKSSSTKAIDDALRADFFLSSQSVGAGAAGISPAVAARLRAEGAIETVVPLRAGELLVRDRLSGVAGIGEGVDDVLAIEMIEGELGALERGELLVDERAAENLRLEVGETVPVSFSRTGEKELVVGGVYEPNQLIGRYLVSMKVFEPNFTANLDFVVLFNGKPDVPLAEVRAAGERAVAEFPNLELQDQASFKQDQIGQVNQLLGLVSVLLSLAIIIAVLGIINTLALSIFERTREIGLLRAVGMSRRQVRAMVRTESVLVSVLGGVLGVSAGVALGWLVVQSLAEQGFDVLRVPVGQLAVFLVVAALAGLVASLVPARRAAHLEVLTAIHHT